MAEEAIFEEVEGVYVGIDFGTSNSVVTYFKDNKFQQVKFKNKKIVPTALFYRGKNNNFCTTYKNYIAYVSRDTQSEFSDNKFNIYLISTQSDYIRQLTTTGKNLFPRFSSYGDTMLYIKHFKKGSALGIIRLMYNKSYLFPLKLGKLQAIDW